MYMTRKFSLTYNHVIDLLTVLMKSIAVYILTEELASAQRIINLGIIDQ